MNRQMVMVGFLQAQNCTNIPSSWRHPESRTDFMAPEYYQEIARVLEAGKFHLAFFDDRLAMAAVTTRLGLGATGSTTYFEPFDIARTFATIDLMTHGRAAWNVVTSVNDGEALNMGRTEHIPHDLRYDRADEFMEIVLGHWDAWDDDALI